MTRKALVLLLFLSLFFACEAMGGIFVSAPKDKLTTFSKIIKLSGTVKDVQILKINNQPLKFNPDGSFSCSLSLSPGKNFVEVRAVDKRNRRFIKNIRILNLKTFSDMEILYEGQKHWARKPIIYLSSLGFIEGYPDDNYYPANPVTRGELAAWIARAKRLKIAKLTEDVFFDVPKEHWRAPEIKAAVDAGYITGYDKTTFGLDDPISRREAAEVAVIAEGLGVVKKITPLFVDVPKEEKGAIPIYVAGKTGLVKGVSKDIPVFDPDRALSRAETAVLISRFKNASDSINYLFNFAKGFSKDNFCRLSVPPEIAAFTVEPGSIVSRSKSVVRLRVKIGSRKGFFPISRVQADLSQIGGLPDTEMFDDGTHGDEKKGDLVYSLNISLEPEESGTNILIVKASDQLGLESEKQASLLILE
jgi:hypothetical protein